MSGLVYAVLAVSLNAASFDVADYKTCLSQVSKRSIEACTRIIEAPEADANKRAGAYVSRGMAYLKGQKLTSALNNFSDVVRLRPNDASAYTRRGHVYMVLRRFEKAIADYEMALRLEPGEEAALLGLGVSSFENEAYLRALWAFDEVLRVSPRDGATYARRALTNLTIGKPELALIDVERAVALQPDHDGIERLRNKIFSAVNSARAGF